MSLLEDNLDKLADLFPNVITEVRGEDGKLKRAVNFEMLKLMFSPDDIADGREYYSFTWSGKRNAVTEAGRPTDKVLRPCIEESKNFETTQNLYIEGENLEVLKIIQRAYMNKIKFIYIDPPYNTGHDFVYSDNYRHNQKEDIKQFELFDEEGEKNFSSENYGDNLKSNPHFHSDWCSMIYPRLLIARNVLRDDGVIFISIDDNEAANLKKICDEIFGESNFIAQLAWKGRGGRQDSKYFAVIHEYILCYAKNILSFTAGEELKEEDSYPKYDEEKKRYYKTQLLRKWGSNSRREDRPNLFYPIKAPDGSDVYPMLSEGKEGRWRWSQDRMNQAINEGRVEFIKEGCWRWGEDTMKQAIKEGRVEFQKQSNGSWIAYEKIYAPLEGEERTKKYTTWIDNIPNGTEILKKLLIPFDYPKSPELITHLMMMASIKNEDIILDLFSSSATTAHAVMNLNHEDGGNRKFIMVQIQEPCKPESEAAKAGFTNICEIGKERIRRAGENLNGDTGFRVLKLDSSNMRDVYIQPENLTRLILDDLIENIKPDRTGIDLLFECITRFGMPLSLAYKSENVNGFTVHTYGDNLITACFDAHINEELIKNMARRKSQRAVFRDSCFENAAVKINLEQIFRSMLLIRTSKYYEYKITVHTSKVSG